MAGLEAPFPVHVIVRELAMLLLEKAKLNDVEVLSPRGVKAADLPPGESARSTFILRQNGERGEEWRMCKGARYLLSEHTRAGTLSALSSAVLAPIVAQIAIQRAAGDFALSVIVYRKYPVGAEPIEGIVVSAEPCTVGFVSAPPGAPIVFDVDNTRPTHSENTRARPGATTEG